MTICKNTQKDRDVCPCPDRANYWKAWAKGAVKPVVSFTLEDLTPPATPPAQALRKLADNDEPWEAEILRNAAGALERAEAKLAEADRQHESKLLDAQEESYNDGYAEAQRQSQATIDHWRTLYEDSQEQARRLVESANKRTERIRHLWYAVSDGDMDRLSVTYALKDLL